MVSNIEIERPTPPTGAGSRIPIVEPAVRFGTGTGRTIDNRLLRFGGVCARLEAIVCDYHASTISSTGLEC